MIYSVDIQAIGSDNKSITLPVVETDHESPFFVTSIDGIDPVQSEVRSVDYGSLDGVYFHNSRVSKRNIVINIRYRGGPMDIASRRRALMGIIQPTRDVLVNINLSDSVVYTTARVEKVEYTSFSNTSDLQISLICPDPYFYDIDATQLNAKAGQSVDIPSGSTGPSGFVLTSDVTSTFGFAILSASDREVLRFNGTGFAKGDTIRISTVPTDRSFGKLNSGVVTQMLNNIVKGSLTYRVGWASGERMNLTYYRNDGFPILGASYTITYNKGYTGI